MAALSRPTTERGSSDRPTPREVSRAPTGDCVCPRAQRGPLDWCSPRRRRRPQPMRRPQTDMRPTKMIDVCSIVQGARALTTPLLIGRYHSILPFSFRSLPRLPSPPYLHLFPLVTDIGCAPFSRRLSSRYRQGLAHCGVTSLTTARKKGHLLF